MSDRSGPTQSVEMSLTWSVHNNVFVFLYFSKFSPARTYTGYNQIPFHLPNPTGPVNGTVHRTRPRSLSPRNSAFPSDTFAGLPCVGIFVSRVNLSKPLPSNRVFSGLPLPLLPRKKLPSTARNLSRRLLSNPSPTLLRGHYSS